jgi:putative transposase
MTRNLKYKVKTNQNYRLNKTLNGLYEKRREQTKQFLGTVANYLYKEYDAVIIGDYVPSTDTAKYDNMHRSMLNQEHIGKFRKV